MKPADTTPAIDVLLLAAGLGTRLAPLTQQIPKALLPVCGLPMLDYHLALIRTLSTPPIRRIVVNGHHLAAQVRDHLDAVAPLLGLRRCAVGDAGVRPVGAEECGGPRADQDDIAAPLGTSGLLAFSHEPVILGTGGALVKAAGCLRSDPCVMLNADAFFPAPIAEAVAFHRASTFTATMVLTPAPFWPNVLVKDHAVTGILRGKRDPRGFTFTGLHVISQSLFEHLPAEGFCDIRDPYEPLMAAGRLGAFIWPEAGPAPAFLDIGTPEAYLEAHRQCADPGDPLAGIRAAATRLGLGTPPGKGAGGPHQSGDGATRVVSGRYGYVDPRAEIGADAVIAESVVLPGAEVAPGAEIRHAIIGPGARVHGVVKDSLVTTLGNRELGSRGE